MIRSVAVPASPPAREWNRRAAGWTARASFALIAIWIAAATAARHLGWLGAWQVLELPFYFVCHRMPERVLSVLGTPMPLCSRCAGVWLGLSVSAALAWPRLPLRTLRVVVAVAAALLVGELVTQDLGLHPVCHATRMLSGLLLSIPLGGAIGGVIVRELQRD